MKEYLENLEIGEEKIKLSKDEVNEILVKHGKTVTTEKEKAEESLKKEIENYKNTISELKTKLESMPKNEDLISLQNKISEMEEKEEQRIAAEKSKSEDEILTKNIISVFGNKKFTNDYVKNGLINDIKEEYSKKENKGKGINEIFDELTKDKAGIFENPNQPTDMPGMKKIKSDPEVTKEIFEKMSYKQRVELKQNDPELYDELKK